MSPAATPGSAATTRWAGSRCTAGSVRMCAARATGSAVSVQSARPRRSGTAAQGPHTLGPIRRAACRSPTSPISWPPTRGTRRGSTGSQTSCTRRSTKRDADDAALASAIRGAPQKATQRPVCHGPRAGALYRTAASRLWQCRENCSPQETFVAHSCGHDIHMASWVGTAKTLVGLKDRWHGTLMFIAQPAEEIAAGAKAMLADGLFERFPKPNFGFALHDGAFAYGTVLYTIGIRSSNLDGLYIKFRGRGGHGAVPQETIDPVMMAARFVVDVQSVVSREKDPTEFGLVSIGAIHGGTAANIIPDDVVLVGTIRTFKPEVRAKMLAGIERTAKAVATMSNGPEPEIKITEGTKAVINDPGVVGTAETVLKAAFGDKFEPSPPVTASEDYSEFINAGVPSMFFNIGVYEPERVAAAREGDGSQLPGNHSPLFAPVPKPTIETGVEAMTLAVLSVFDQPARGK